MRLSSIKLSGFKSFVDPTHFQVPGQLVGVVGPNGCGKSNIIDAVRWVLGESKASELRGESMQDVIFNGSLHRKPSGRSSVELLFDNSEGRVSGSWGQYAEIAVKRTLTRDGTSQYYINNQVVRRRDIQDIFLGTGLGPRAYAIIGQGMIARIIEARPEELRIFLEEAAGISKYKERRRETENRLEDTRENLSRLGDILLELNNNLEKLTAQAEVAREFNTLHAKQEESQKLLWLLRKQEAQAEQAKVFAEIEKTQNNLEEHTAKMRRFEAELEETRQAHYTASDRVHQSQGLLYQINAEVSTLEAQIKFVKESKSRLQVQLTSLEGQCQQWQSQVQQNQAELSEVEFLSQEQGEHVAQARELLQQAIDLLPQHVELHKQAQTMLEESRAKIMQIRQQLEFESTHQRNAAATLTSLANRRERLMQEKNNLDVPDSDHLAALRAQLQERQTDLEIATQKLQTIEQTQPTLEEERRGLQEELNQETEKTAQLEARLNALVQLQENVQAQEKVQPWLAKHGLNELPRLWQRVKIEAGWETALESILRERTSGLEVSNINLVEALFNDLPSAKLAVYANTVMTSGQTPASTMAASNELVSLHSLLKLNDPNLRLVLEDWLHGVFTAKDVTAAFTKRHLLPQGACFVTKQGHVISRNGVQFYALDSEQDGVLARQLEIENTGKQLRAQQFLKEEIRARLVRAEAALSDLVQQLQATRAQCNTLTQSVHQLQMESVKLSELCDRFNQRSSQIDVDLAELIAAEAEQQEIKQALEINFEKLDEELAILQEKHEEIQTDYMTKEQALADAREEHRKLERAEQESSFVGQSQRTKIEELKRTIAVAVEQVENLRSNMQQGSLDLQVLDEQLNSASLLALLEQRTVQERALSDVRGELDQVAQKLRKFEETRMEHERELQPYRDKITELQLKEQAARLNQEQYAAQLQEVEADEVALAEKLTSDVKASYLQAEVTRLNNAIANLGAVNMAALGELEQALTRKEFLDMQNADLVQAINTLEDAIRKIDAETRALLQDTFDKVNLHFSELFPILFGGGQAKLVMTGEEILDSGVQVMAQPPGKKNATIHLLSGGEKALTATALIFSMFQLNPAPFCLLDEVDAPLDDANTERFCKMVKQMSAKTQFLFISHNKIAMEMAQQLIGVTMQEQGVSRIVAVDVEAAANFAFEGQVA